MAHLDPNDAVWRYTGRSVLFDARDFLRQHPLPPHSTPSQADRQRQIEMRARTHRRDYDWKGHCIDGPSPTVHPVGPGTHLFLPEHVYCADLRTSLHVV